MAYQANMSYLVSMVLATVVVVGVAGASADINLPEGWRFPTSAELEDDSLFREESPTGFARSVADFDGDGQEDSAFLLKSTKFSGQGLLVKLAGTSDEDWLVLDEIRWGDEYPSVPLAMGMEVAPPGAYQTACGKGYWDCQPGEPEELNLSTPGLIYFRFASASSMFHWDAASESFQRTWLSD